MVIDEITDFFQFCKWAELQYAISLSSSEKFDRLLFYPDMFAQQLENDKYSDEFIKTMINYVHKYKLDRIKNKLPEIKEYDYKDENDRYIIRNFNRVFVSRIDYGIKYI